MKLTIVVTAYNERDTILKAIQEVKKISLEKEIIIVDNCSTDGTRDILRGLNDPLIKVVYQSDNYGYGRSIITGMDLAKGRYLFVYNSDLEYDSESVYRMMEMAEKDNLDFVFGSRLFYRRQESRLKIFLERPFYLGTIITTWLINIFYKKNFTDIIGNRFYRTESLRSLHPRSNDWAFDFEVVSKICKAGLRAAEIPVKYEPRTKGKKIKVSDIIPAIWIILKVKFFN